MRKPTGHIIHAITDSGRIIVLDDGSSWLIEPDDRKISGKWKPGTRVDVSTVAHPESVIANMENHTAVRGVYAGQR
jgi:hypothetical protein